jgi:hypothetical protein
MVAMNGGVMRRLSYHRYMSKESSNLLHLLVRVVAWWMPSPVLFGKRKEPRPIGTKLNADRLQSGTRRTGLIR